MNKFVAIALLAFVAVAAAENVTLVDLEDPETQLSLTPSNEEETAALFGDATMFADYCIKSRDYVLGDIKHQTNSLAGTVFTMFFKNAEQIGQNALEAERLATERLGNQIRNPDAAIEPAREGDSAYEMIVDGQHKIQAEQVQPKTFFQAVVSTVGATVNAASSSVVSALNNLKSSFGLDRVVGALGSVCDQVAHYEEQNRQAYQEFASKLASKDATLAATPFERVPCLTARRVSRMDGICKFSTVVKDPVTKIMRSMQ